MWGFQSLVGRTVQPVTSVGRVGGTWCLMVETQPPANRHVTFRRDCIRLLPAAAQSGQRVAVATLQDEDGQGRPGRYTPAGAANANLAAHAIKAGKVCDVSHTSGHTSPTCCGAYTRHV